VYAVQPLRSEHKDKFFLLKRMDDDAAFDAFAEEIRKEISAIRLKVDTYIRSKEMCDTPLSGNSRNPLPPPVLSSQDLPKEMVQHLPTNVHPLIETVLKRVCMKAEEVLDTCGLDGVAKWCEEIIKHSLTPSPCYSHIE
jgi:hypothetical protein